MIVGKVFANSAAFTDAQDLPLTKVVSDSANFSDVPQFARDIFLADTAFVTDDADGIAGDDSTFTFIKTVSNFSVLTDNDTIGFGTVQNNGIGLSDAGVGRSQGYCAFDYFAEDYVGTSFTF